MGSVIGTSPIGSPTLEPLGIVFGPPMSHQNTDQRQIDHQVFLQQNGFIQDQQRIAVWGLQCGQPHESPPTAREGELFYRAENKLGGLW